MAKVNGTPPFVGTVDGVTIYKMGDHYYSRKKSSYGKDEIMAEPSREEHRQNMKGFGYSSIVGREIREHWREMGARGMDATVSGRLTAQIYGVQRLGKGEKGFQPIEFTQHGYLLEGFPLTKDRNPSQHLSHTPAWSHKAAQGEDEASITLHFHPDTQVNLTQVPEGATYYALLLHATSLPDYHWNARSQAFEPRNAQGAVTSAFVESPCIPLPHPPANAMIDTLTVRLPEETPEGHCTLITWGIEYFTEVNGEIEPIYTSQSARSIVQTHCHMGILAVQGSAERPATAQAAKRKAVAVATIVPKVEPKPVDMPVVEQVQVQEQEEKEKQEQVAAVEAPSQVQVQETAGEEQVEVQGQEQVAAKAAKTPKEPKKPKEQPSTAQMSLF